MRYRSTKRDAVLQALHLGGLTYQSGLCLSVRRSQQRQHRQVKPRLYNSPPLRKPFHEVDGTLIPCLRHAEYQAAKKPCADGGNKGNDQQPSEGFFHPRTLISSSRSAHSGGSTLSRFLRQCATVCGEAPRRCASLYSDLTPSSRMACS